MKATGIVRRIDELGRVVIPKELRKTLRICEGTPLEIYTEKDALVLRKYSPMATMEDDAKDFLDTLSEMTERKSMLTDCERVLCVSSQELKPCLNMPVSEEFISLLREKKSVLINIGRGLSVDTEALADVLENGSILGAALDVFEKEPLPENSRLWKLDNLLISPHICSGSNYMNKRVYELVYDNLKALTEGKELKNRII